MNELIPICIFCENEADTEPDMCYNCKDYDGIIFVSKKEWLDDNFTFEEIKKYDANGEAI
jgi:hypothetical protein